MTKKIRNMFVLLVAALLINSGCCYAESNETDTLYPIRVNNLWGYMNQDGEIVIAPQWKQAGQFRGKGFAVVIFEYGKNGIINREGEYVLPPEYIVDQGDQGRYYGGKDTGIIKYSSLGNNNLFGFFDVSSSYLSEMAYFGICLLAVSDSDLIAVDFGGYNNTGFVSRHTGEVVIQGQFDCEYPSQFNEGWALVAVTDYENEDTVFHLIDEKGNTLMIADNSITPVRSFSNGLCLVECYETEKYGYIDETGTIVIPLQFDGANNFDDHGIAKVWIEDQQYYINKNGEYVSNETFPNFSMNSALQVQIVDSNGNIAISYEEGYKFNLSFEYESFRYFTEDLQVLVLDGKFGFVDREGEAVIDFFYDYARNFENGLAYAVKDGKMLYINYKGEVIWQEP